MARTLNQLKTEIATLTTKVSKETDAKTAIITAIQGIAAQNKALAEQIKSMDADDVTQADIDALAASVHDAATVAEQNAAGLAQAAIDNTPAAGAGGAATGTAAGATGQADADQKPQG